MKKINLFMLAFLIVMVACKKNTFHTLDKEGVTGKALVKFGIFNAPGIAPTFLVYDNGERISNALTLSSAGYPFPGGGFNTAGSNNGDYLALNTGSHKFEFFTTNPGTLNLTGKFFETTQTFDPDKRYTIYTTDTSANAVAITTPDDTPSPDTAFSRIRFINLIPNASVDFYKGNTLLQSNIQYKAYTDFFDIKYGSDSFSVRLAGSPAGTALSATAYRVIAPTSKRIYSFLSRGYVGQTGNRAPMVAAIINQ